MDFSRTVAGIDGCRSGWFLVRIGAEQELIFGVSATLEGAWRQCREVGCVFIDIPIGLPSDGKRDCDMAARKILGKARASSVFPPPCREALTAGTYEEACRINQAVLGKKLTRQTWNILPKIREVDAFFAGHPKAGTLFYESHPEICYTALSDRHSMIHSKKTEKGCDQRVEILKNYLELTESIFKAARQRYTKKELADDDILDALVLAVSACLPARHRKTVPDQPPLDERGLPMRITYATPSGGGLSVTETASGKVDISNRYGSHQKDCLFCQWIKTGTAIQTLGTVAAFADGHPVTEDHLLIVPARHVSDWFAMNEQELGDSRRLIRQLAEKIQKKDPAVSGFNIGTNAGRSAGQTIFHAHIHLIPRRDGDCLDPTGGVRGVIDGKRSYR